MHGCPNRPLVNWIPVARRASRRSLLRHTSFHHKLLGTVKFVKRSRCKDNGLWRPIRRDCLLFQGFITLNDLGHNLFSMGQSVIPILEVAFRQHTCFIRNLEGVDLLTGSQRDNLYTLSLGNMMASSPICLLSKASKTKSWLWHRSKKKADTDTTTKQKPPTVPKEKKEKKWGKGKQKA
ncbi:hypothetical protein Tco_0085799 [Tanacetum coccineum]